LLDAALVVFEPRGLLSRKPRDGVPRDVTRDLHLAGEWQHVGCEPRAEQHARIEFSLRGIRAGLLENQREVPESVAEHLDRQRVHQDFDASCLSESFRWGARAQFTPDWRVRLGSETI
jgi:hypothetical protein